jgi:hypothetical protein
MLVQEVQTAIAKVALTAVRAMEVVEAVTTAEVGGAGKQAVFSETPEKPKQEGSKEP